LRTHEPTRIDIEPMTRFETYDYPGSYTARDHGAGLTRLRMEEEEARHHRIFGSGSCVGFDAGKRFTLAVDEGMGEEKPEIYLLTELRHSAREPGYFSTSGEPAIYSNRFVAIPAETPFRPERLTSKPVVQGPQTATVVGPAGENIHTDQYGRVRVLFHWDRRGKRDEHASCWIRVSQNAAGSHWGGLATPHVGQEVVVSFLEGDPDRPIVTGHVHNGNNLPPLNLPYDKDKTILRDHGDNKIIMQGRPGREHLTLVSPRTINMIAARPPAKPLSSDVTLDQDGIHGADPFEDAPGLDELNKLWKALVTPGQQPADPLQDLDLIPSGPGDPSFADTATHHDANTIAEGSINELSGLNTSSWIGRNLNTWVGGDMNQEVKGKTNTVSDDSVSNTYKKQVTDNFDSLHEENTVVHNEVTGVHVEEVAAHVEATLVHAELTGAHIEFTEGIHIEHAIGLHSDLSPTSDFDGEYLTMTTTATGPVTFTTGTLFTVNAGGITLSAPQIGEGITTISPVMQMNGITLTVNYAQINLG
jgi:hypothetical protein